MQFRVVSWNIHKGIGGADRRYRLERIVEVLQALAPDIAMLQEVAEDMPRSHFHDQPSALAEALEMKHLAFGPEHRFRMGGYGNAILSRWPLTDISRVDLTIGTRKKRGALTARAHVHGPAHEHQRSLVLVNMHLGLAGSERGLQLERFLASHPFAHLQRRTPVILGGDLNDVWGSLGPRYLQPAGFGRCGSLLNTFPAYLPVRPLDGVFVRGDLESRGISVPKTKLAKQASDHLPLVADLNLVGLEA
ncbi:MAG TPA: endonuclease/exonuclease/phosphatase family protein [Polyangiaceae bacterium]|nr:endonuclease/exonuclease/phosphatase family protein [Polyangiaceae bacterium]